MVEWSSREMSRCLPDPDTVWETLTVPGYGGGTASISVEVPHALFDRLIDTRTFAT
jgi:hypothetical protein